MEAFPAGKHPIYENEKEHDHGGQPLYQVVVLGRELGHEQCVSRVPSGHTGNQQKHGRVPATGERGSDPEDGTHRAGHFAVLQDGAPGQQDDGVVYSLLVGPWVHQVQQFDGNIGSTDPLLQERYLCSQNLGYLGEHGCHRFEQQMVLNSGS